MASIFPSIDHHGVKFSSFEQMCRHYGHVSATVRSRLVVNGMTLEEALTRDGREERVDHKGQVYRNLTDMCLAYQKDYALVARRLKAGLSIEEALTREVDGRCRTVIILSDGRQFKSLSEFIREFGFTRFYVEKLLKRGHTCDEISQMPMIVHVDHLGNKYRSIKAMCDHYGILVPTYMKRIQNNWSKKDALTIPIAFDV